MYDSNLSDKIVHYMHLVANGIMETFCIICSFLQVSMRLKLV